MPVVEFKDVTKVYDGGSVAVDQVSMRIGRGEFVFLVGPTGCGKSTCIRLLQKELEPSKGEIAIAGRQLGEIPRSRVPYLRRNIGVVFQDYKLLPNRTVYDNVAYSLQVIGERARRSAARCRTSCAWSGSRRSSTTFQTSSRAASSNASRSRARS